MATTGEEASAKIAEAGCFANSAGEQAGAKSAKEDPRELTSTGMVSQGSLPKTFDVRISINDLPMLTRRQFKNLPPAES